MATLWITEYHEIPIFAPGNAAPMASEPAVADQTVTFTTATASNAFNSAAKYVRLYPSANCHVKFGSAPTATASMQKLAAGVEYWRGVVAGQKVSVYDGSS